MIGSLLLDAHGTLVDLEPPAPILRELLERRLGLAVSLEQAERAITAEITYYRAHLSEGRDRLGVELLRARCSEVLREALGAEGLLERVRASAPVFQQLLLASLRFRPFPDAVSTLRELRSRGVRVVVVSNWDASLPETLARVGLQDEVDGVVASAALGAAKPDPAIFRAGLALIGGVADEAVHVGDSPTEDVAGARAAGIEAVLIVRDRAPAPPGVRVIRSLGELLGWPEMRSV